MNRGHLVLVGLVFFLCFIVDKVQLSAAQDPTKSQAIIPGKRCPISAQKSWTTQEKWVWEQVCKGEVANLANKYGGSLDPRKSDAWPLERVLRPMFLESIVLHEPYREALTYNGVRIRGAWFKSPIDLSNATLARVLRLDDCRFDSSVTLFGVKSRSLISVLHSKFNGKLILSLLQMESSLFMRDGAEFIDVDLVGAKVGGQIDMTSSKFKGTLNMNSLEIGSNLFMNNGAEFTEVDLRGAKVGGQINMASSKFKGKLNMDGLQVEGKLLMRDKAEFAEVDLLGANVGGQIDMTGSKFKGKLIMDSLQVERSLLMRNGAEFAEVILRGAKVGGQISLIKSKFEGKLNMNMLQVEGSLLMRDGAEFAEVDLQGAKVGGKIDMTGSKFKGKLIFNSLEVAGQIDMSGSKFDRKLSLDSAQVGSSIIMRDNAEFAEVILRGAKVGDQVSIISAKFKDKLSMNSLQVGGSLFMHDGAEFAEVDLFGAAVEGQISMSGSKFKGKLIMSSLRVENDLLMHDEAEFAEVDLRGADMGGRIIIGRSKFKGRLMMDSLRVADSIIMRNGAEFDDVYLRGAEVGQSLAISGIKLLSLDLTGTRIHREFRLISQKQSPVKWDQNSKLTLINTYVGYLQDSPDAWPNILKLDGFTYSQLGDMSERKLSWLKDWLAKDNSYSPQPYKHLANELQKVGYADKAKGILFTAKAREHSNTKDPWSWMGLTLQWMLIGYGYYNFRAFVWFMVLWGIGILVLKCFGQVKESKLPWWGSAYSFDRLLPIMELRKQHHDDSIELKNKVRVYFYFHRLFGYVLALYLIAGLSGLTK